MVLPSAGLDEFQQENKPDITFLYSTKACTNRHTELTSGVDVHAEEVAVSDQCWSTPGIQGDIFMSLNMRCVAYKVCKCFFFDMNIPLRLTQLVCYTHVF